MDLSPLILDKTDIEGPMPSLLMKKIQSSYASKSAEKQTYEKVGLAEQVEELK
jgi:hypothetical protein